jgi:hypothetical protein
MTFGGIFDYEEKKNRLEIVNAALEAPDVWNDPENAQALGKEKKALDHVVLGIDQIEQGLRDAGEFARSCREPRVQADVCKPSRSQRLLSRDSIGRWRY